MVVFVFCCVWCGWCCCVDGVKLCVDVGYVNCIECWM